MHVACPGVELKQEQLLEKGLKLLLITLGKKDEFILERLANNKTKPKRQIKKLFTLR